MIDVKAGLVIDKVSELSLKELAVILLKLGAIGLIFGAVLVAPGLIILGQYFPNANRGDRQRIKRTLKRFGP